MLDKKHISQLCKIVGPGNVLTSKEDLHAYSYDGSTVWRHMPEVVVLPSDTKQVSLIMEMANQSGIAVTPRGGGTNVSGGSVPIKGGIVLSTTRMNGIIEINKHDLTATVEPGLVLNDLKIALAKEGLFYPPDPQSFMGCTIGGNINENSSGPGCLKYGVTKHYVLGLEVVLPDGYIMNLGGLTPKNRTGYDLSMLFTGSEGTLGIITKIILRILPIPPARKTIMGVFDTTSAAAAVVPMALEKGILPSMAEFVDNFSIRKAEEVAKMGLPTDAKFLFLVEIDGSFASVETEASQIEEIMSECGAREIKIAKDATEAEKFWGIRKIGVGAVFNVGRTILLEDVSVPRSRLAEYLETVERISEKYDVFIQMIGHAADGGLHPAVVTDIEDKDHFEKSKKAAIEIFESALAVGGVLTGEHGIGLEKMDFLKKAIDGRAIEVMKKIKAALDPNNILNPGKIWEDQSEKV
jgi:glycolate oxidase